ncbi:MAG TPA: hypothetical protein VN841_23550 [Bryobacteraceae bacterium]|nr:hypothetical protein [Bryobacteraceae bacterium]
MLKTLRVLLVIAAAAYAQETLNNDAVVKMVKAGLGETLVINMIQTQPGNYTLTPDALVKLKQDGVSDKVLGAMIARGSGAPAAAAGAPPAAPTSPVLGATDTDIPQGLDIGVYYKKGGKWEEMLPEVVNWKTGGVVKHVASAGIVKGDVNGHLQSQHSRNMAASPVEVLIYAPEGVAITEYQLLHLREANGTREFRTVTGGVFHESGGAQRDLLQFEGKKVANRMYRVSLPSLGAGEYGFLPPGAITSSNSASLGKMYTFRLE